MLPADVAPAAEMILAHDWGVRRDWLAFAASNPSCFPVVAEAGGSIVATGVGTVNGPAGWVGTVFVAPDQRGHGLGRAITQAVIDNLEDAGCRTLVLVATTEGRRLYERMGFGVQTHYRILEAPGLPQDPAAGEGDAVTRVRPFEQADLHAIAGLDRAATGEDRLHALRRLAAPDTARVAVRPDGALCAFLVRPPWGGGATVARSIEDALAVIDARRRATGPAGRVRVGLLDDNAAGLARLAAHGFTKAWSAPRMVRGAPLDWMPDMLWGQFNHAMG